MTERSRKKREREREKKEKGDNSRNKRKRKKRYKGCGDKPAFNEFVDVPGADVAEVGIVTVTTFVLALQSLSQQI